MARQPDAFDNVDTAADDTCLLAFTSGTTGQPKATMHFHRDVMASCVCWPPHVLRANADDVFIGSPPLAFTFGLGGLLLFPMHIGASTVLLEKAGAERAARRDRGRARDACCSPRRPRTARWPTPRGSAASRRRTAAACASASRPARRCRRRRARSGARRPASRSSTASARPRCCTSSSRTTRRMRGPARPASPCPATAPACMDDAGRPVPARHDRQARGARARPAAATSTTRARRSTCSDGWNLTGDAYLMDADGYFHYQSRTDDMIVSSGYNIAAPEVEDALLLHPAVAECAVIGVPDAERGQIVKAFVVLRAGARGRATATGARAAGLRQGRRSRRTSTRARSNSAASCRAPRPASCSASACAIRRSGAARGR